MHHRALSQQAGRRGIGGHHQQLEPAAATELVQATARRVAEPGRFAGEAAGRTTARRAEAPPGTAR